MEYIMGAAMMEPDVRIETNRLGFCKLHFEQMRAQKNRLSLALMLETHLQELQKTVFAKKKLFESKSAKKEKTAKVNADCFVCAKIQWGMDRLLVTLFEMYEKSADFRTLFAEQELLCLPHYEMLTGLSPTHAGKKTASAFDKACETLAANYLTALSADVSHYCKMYDYRNSGAGADWGNAKDSIERAIRFLTSR